MVWRLHLLVLAALLGSVGLLFFAQGVAEHAPAPNGIARLGTMFWLLAGLALALYLAAVVVLMAKPTATNLLYALMALCQAGNLVLLAVESAREPGLNGSFLDGDMPVRMAFDLVTAAAAVHAASLYPRFSPSGRRVALAAWATVGILVGLVAFGRLSNAWWWAQGGVAAMCAVAIGLVTVACRHQPHPVATPLRNLGIAALGGWLSLTLAVAVADKLPSAALDLAAAAPTVWALYVSWLLLVPLLSRSEQITGEFSLVAAVGLVATALNVMLAAVFALGTLASLLLSLLVSLAVYSGARRWIVNNLLSSRAFTTERMFNQLYRIAREAETQPQRVAALLLQLLRELFDALEAELVDDAPHAAQVVDAGRALQVPIPILRGHHPARASSIRLAFAQRGRRVFTRKDARLADRIVEQLRRAVAFDHAVEQGRSEERARLAQDLHDDIGARLLTLMYKSQSPEMEEYVRHTLKDLKTLTRGLAASSHPLSHAVAEWKADLTQRLTAADIALGWKFNADRDIALSVVQWSALTRILRELVSNAIAHANARRVDVELTLLGDRLDLSVVDDGSGKEPGHWSHGLGLSGVRKRVKQLGGSVVWREAEPNGIDCRVHVPLVPASD
jgi:signal transduction histidine kinase